ncbi:Protein CBG26565 [Caenorhabditis briggsae]|uniref:Protein CBG26565 n=1 Tax=Caenorhabditis briggsae TaxID=6238 RepID=B6IGZ9_CAEBR|nr:Protein CBG26565 [Caenorhabditis briggsae]CAR99179.1 Protein CBG26565 [Caenorhabditis briggsae]
MKDEPVFYTIPLDSPPSSRRSGPSSPAQKAPTSDDHVLIFPNRSGSKKRRARTSDGSSHEAKQVDAQIPAQRSDVYIVRSQPSQELLESSRWTAASAARKTEKPQTPPKSPVIDAPEAAADPPKMIVRAPMAPLVRAPPPEPNPPAPAPAVQEHAHEPPASCWQWFVYCCCCKCCYKT